MGKLGCENLSLSKFGSFSSSVGVPNFYFAHCCFQLSSILSSFISYIQTAFHVKLPYFEPGC